MMMRILQAGGLPVLTDDIRKPDEDNPHGYYEFEPAKRLKEDSSWLVNATGKAVKIIYALLYHLEQSQRYKIILMERDLEEVLASQRAMLNRLGRDGGALGRVSTTEAAAAFRREMDRVEIWLRRQQNIDLLKMHYREVLSKPREKVLELQRFLDSDLDLRAMESVVDWSLYRRRAVAPK
jgi:hypothetical protein